MTVSYIADSYTAPPGSQAKRLSKVIPSIAFSHMVKDTMSPSREPSKKTRASTNSKAASWSSKTHQNPWHRNLAQHRKVERP